MQKPGFFKFHIPQTDVGLWENSVFAIDLTDNLKFPFPLKHNLNRFGDCLRNWARHCLGNRRWYCFRHRFRNWLRNWCRYRLRYYSWNEVRKGGAGYWWRCGNSWQPRFGTGNLWPWKWIGSGINHGNSINKSIYLRYIKNSEYDIYLNSETLFEVEFCCILDRFLGVDYSNRVYLYFIFDADNQAICHLRTVQAVNH